jgi:type II secretory pathway component PulK
MSTRRGIALIIVLAIVAILSVLVIEFCYSVWIDMHLSANYDARTQAVQAAKAGVEYAVYLLRRDEDPRVDWLGEEWAKPIELTIGELAPPPDPEEDELSWLSEPDERRTSRYVEPRFGGTAKVLIVDEDRKLSLNMLSYKSRIAHPVFVGALERLIENLDTQGQMWNAAELVEQIVDWVDNDDEPEWAYDTNEHPYLPMNRPFATVHELRLVADMTDVILYGTVPYPDIEPGYVDKEADWWQARTVLPENGSYGLINFVHAQSAQLVNINTAPPEVLAALFEWRSGIEETIMEERLEKPFQSTEDFLTRLDLNERDDPEIKAVVGWLGVRSLFFRITSIGEYHGVRVKVTAIVNRSSRPDVTVQYYRVENIE